MPREISLTSSKGSITVASTRPYCGQVVLTADFQFKLLRKGQEDATFPSRAEAVSALREYVAALDLHEKRVEYHDFLVVPSEQPYLLRDLKVGISKVTQVREGGRWIGYVPFSERELTNFSASHFHFQEVPNTHVPYSEDLERRWQEALDTLQALVNVTLRTARAEGAPSVIASALAAAKEEIKG